MAQQIRKLFPTVYKGFLKEALFVIMAYILYSLVRVSISEQVLPSFGRALNLMEIERKLGLFWELEIQGWMLSYPILIEFFNQFYLWSYLPALCITAIWLYWFHKNNYVLFRNAFLASGGIALLLFKFAPTAPPRFFPWLGFQDTLYVMKSMYRSVTVDGFVNNYAAFPSMHFGWILLLGIVLVCVGRGRLIKAVGILLPVMMFVTIIVTGNHYILDAAAGACVALTGLAAAVLLQRHGSALRRGARAAALAIVRPAVSRG